MKMFPLCNLCGEPARCVDHKTPRAAGGEPYTPSNLQSLCNACHAKKTCEEMKNRGFRHPNT